jgi:Protein of unknown function (DUF4242)
MKTNIQKLFQTIKRPLIIKLVFPSLLLLFSDDKIYCIHIAESEDVVREHARIGKFPINTISEVKAVIDPVTSNLL